MNVLVKVGIVFALLISFDSKGQFEKGDLIMSPMIEFKYNERLVALVSSNKALDIVIGHSNLQGIGSMTISKLFTNNLAIGSYVGFDYFSKNAFEINAFDRSVTHYEIGPSVQYIITSSRFTPFIELHGGYSYTREYIDNYMAPPSLRKTYSSSLALGTRIGFMYFVKPKTALQLSINYHKYNNLNQDNLFEKEVFILGASCIFSLSRSDEE